MTALETMPHQTYAPATGDDYQDFLAGKQRRQPNYGVDVADADLNPAMFPFQKALTRWALRKGRAALFADCGLGKTLMQLEYARLMWRQTGKDILILCPLVVAQQTAREAVKFGIDIPVKVCRFPAQVEPGVTIINYERLELFQGLIEAGRWGVVIPDESSVLKSYMGKTKQMLVKLFAETPYRLCNTATPAPNDYLELGNHSAFLGVMPSNEMIARWFSNDLKQAGVYHLKPHGAADFWEWMSSWSMMLSKPSDLGFSDAGFDLPPLNFHSHVLSDIALPPPPGMLFHNGAPSATEMYRVKRETAPFRAGEVAEMINASPENWIVWCDTNDESALLKDSIRDAVEVRGSDQVDEKESKLLAFTNGSAKVIVTKPSIAGFGMNWQHCHNMAFVGLNYSFERFYQAVRRSWRFGQSNGVNVHIVETDAESGINQAVWAKQGRFDEMRQQMTLAVKGAQFMELENHRALAVTPEPRKESGEGWDLWLGDCVDVTRRLPDNSVDFGIHSPPFGNLYIYSDSIADMGNSASDDEFFHHYEYLIPELLRVTVPGRLCAVHCKDLPLYKGRDGAAGLRDFPGQIIRAFEAHCWTYHSRVTIWKDPVVEMQRTKNHGLLHNQLRKDSSASRQGMADYLIVFRKWTDDADFPKPVHHPVGGALPTNAAYRFERGHYVGDEGPEGARSDRDWSIRVWQRYASPVWFDINQMRTLNYRTAKEDGDEAHICPLQLDVIERAIDLWSNKGDMVFSPFAGVGSEGYCAVKRGRRFVGVELKESYHITACKNLAAAVLESNQGLLL